MHWGIRRRLQEHDEWRKKTAKLRDERNDRMQLHQYRRRVNAAIGKDYRSDKTTYQLANEDIVKKYGKTALDDIDRLDFENSAMGVGALLAIFATVSVIAITNPDDNY